MESEIVKRLRSNENFQVKFTKEETVRKGLERRRRHLSERHRRPLLHVHLYSFTLYHIIYVPTSHNQSNLCGLDKDYLRRLFSPFRTVSSVVNLTRKFLTLLNRFTIVRLHPPPYNREDLFRLWYTSRSSTPSIPSKFLGIS